MALCVFAIMPDGKVEIEEEFLKPVIKSSAGMLHNASSSG